MKLQDHAKYVTRIRNVRQLPETERGRLEKVEKKFPFRANDYYLSLIDWDDPHDPIRRIVIPDETELEEWGMLDASGEATFTKSPGLEHKYDQTALLLVSDHCGGYCRFCFRKRLFMEENVEAVRDLSDDFAYIARHPEITDVLLSGGDPLFLPTPRLEEILRRLRTIDHVRIIRIGSKMPVYNPFRILNDPGLLGVIERYSEPSRRLYLITQFNHPRELTAPAHEAIVRLHRAGAVLANQTPILRGVNDDPAVLAELFRELSFAGVAPYYLFQCRPTLGNHHFVVPIEEAYGILEAAKRECSGLAKRLRYVMSHATGKIEVVGLDETQIYFRYHQAARHEDIGRFMAFRRDPTAVWFDDYASPVRDAAVEAVAAI